MEDDDLGINFDWELESDSAVSKLLTEIYGDRLNAAGVEFLKKLHENCALERADWPLLTEEGELFFRNSRGGYFSLEFYAFLDKETEIHSVYFELENSDGFINSPNLKFLANVVSPMYIELISNIGWTTSD